jgi:uncharacterized protein YndB with AHSA1/START domain
MYKMKNYLDPELLLEVLIDAGRVEVYRAWTNLEIFQKWFCPPEFSICKAEMEAVAGGYFRMHMKSVEGLIFPTKGEYILLEEPTRIVYKDSWDDEREKNESVITEVVFEEVDARTNLKLYSCFASQEQKEDSLSSGVSDGWLLFFENLNKVLKATSR